MTWNECGHSLGIADPSIVQQYRDRCIAAGGPVSPDCSTLMPLEIERPVPITPLGLLLLSTVILFSVVLILVLFFSRHFSPWDRASYTFRTWSTVVVMG